jgi:hypothetical protein
MSGLAKSGLIEKRGVKLVLRDLTALEGLIGEKGYYCAWSGLTRLVHSRPTKFAREYVMQQWP